MGGGGGGGGNTYTASPVAGAGGSGSSSSSGTGGTGGGAAAGSASGGSGGNGNGGGLGAGGIFVSPSTGGGGCNTTIINTTPGAAITGGAGGTGGGYGSLLNLTASGGSSGGGGGGDGALITDSLTISNSITGGIGGAATNYGGGAGGGGGAGIVPIVVGKTITNNSTIRGGAGGAGATSINGGRGSGGGGAGVFLYVNSNIINKGTISGGNGGTGLKDSYNGIGGTGAGGATGSVSVNTYSQGGAGIVSFSGGGTTIINAGSISGGLGGNGSTRANAITFYGSGNTLKLENGYSFTGNVVGGTNGTLILGGTTDSSFNLSGIGTTYTGFTSFLKNDSSNWSLTGSTPATQPWQINAGTLTIETGGSVAQSSSVSIASGATFSVANGGNQTIKDLSGGSSTRLILGNNASDVLTLGTSNNISFDGLISGNGGLSKNGMGIFTISANNTYTGGTTVNAGTLNLTGSLAPTGTVTVNTGGTFDLSNNSSAQTIGNLGGTGGEVKLNSYPLTLDARNNTSYAGIISGDSGIIKKGNGEVRLEGATAYTDVTRVDAGTLAVGAGGSIAQSPAVNLSTAGATFSVATGGNQTIKDFSGASGTNLILGNNATDVLALGTSNNTSFEGIASGNGGLLKQGSGIFTLSGNNTYTGGTMVNAGTLNLIGSLAPTGQVTVNTGGTFDLSNNSSAQTIGNLGGTGGEVKLNSYPLTLNVNNNTSYGGIISGNSGIIKKGNGEFTLTGNTTYLGMTTIDAGTLAVGAGGSIAQSAGVNLAASGASLDVSAGGNQTIQDLTGINGTTLILGTNSTDILTVGTANSTTFGGIMSGGGGLAKQGLGTLTLAATNTYTGPTTINSGKLQAGIANAIPANSNVTLSNSTGATLDLNGYNQILGSLAGGGTSGGNVTLGGATLSIGGNSIPATYSGIISGPGSLTKIGTAILELEGLNTYTGPTTINDGSLSMAIINALPANTAVTLANGASVTLDLNNFNQTTGSLAGGGSMGGNVTLGSATLTAGGIILVRLIGASFQDLVVSLKWDQGSRH